MANSENMEKKTPETAEQDFEMVPLRIVQIAQVHNRLYGLDATGRIWILDKVGSGKKAPMRWFNVQGPAMPVLKSELEAQRAPASGLVKPTLIPSANA